MCHIYAQAQAHTKSILLLSAVFNVHVCVLYAMLHNIVCCRNCCRWYCMLPRDIEEINHCIETVMALYVWIWDLMWWENQCSYSTLLISIISFDLIISDIVVAVAAHIRARTLRCTVIAGFEFAIKKNSKQDRIMVALMLLNKISICFVELEEAEKSRAKTLQVIVTIVTHLVLWLVLNLFHTWARPSFLYVSFEFPNISVSLLPSHFIPLSLSLLNNSTRYKWRELSYSRMNRGQMPWSLLWAWKCRLCVPFYDSLFFLLKKGQSI